MVKFKCKKNPVSVSGITGFEMLDRSFCYFTIVSCGR